MFADIPSGLGFFSVAAQDLLDGEELGRSAEEVFPAASLVKIPVLTTLFREYDAGRLDLSLQYSLASSDQVGGAGVLQFLTPGLSISLRDLAFLMVVVSDNTATNVLIDILGMDAVNSDLEEWGLSETRLRRKLMTDLTSQPANFTTPREMVRLLARIYGDTGFSKESRESMLTILQGQQFREIIPRWLPPDVPVAHKTGEITGVRHDAGIVLLPERPFAICLSAKDLTSGPKGEEALAEISLEVFDYFRTKGVRGGRTK
ncbi:MAG: serine hydrolase [Armatimonadetes bacterium]|nr:serine hydrolase [Armatimonadota bacterium]